MPNHNTGETPGSITNLYTLEAWYPNATVKPSRHYFAHWADGLEYALTLVTTNRHTTIRLRTYDGLEVFNFWGQLKDFP